MDSCGGCIYEAGSYGRDCTAIKHIDGVSCVAGRCAIGELNRGEGLKIDSCQQGYSPSLNGTMCGENY
jgi:hypothetical protein